MVVLLLLSLFSFDKKNFPLIAIWYKLISNLFKKILL